MAACNRCSNDVVIGKKHCRKCLDSFAEQGKRKLEKYGLLGKCLSCGIKVEPDKRRCPKCSEKRRIGIRERNACRKKGMRCRLCNNKEFLTDNGGNIVSNFCQECYLKHMSGKHLGSYHKWQILLDMLYRNDWRCVYSGEKLEPGKNLSFDHLDPIARFPDRKHDATNIVPCTKSINLMKRDMTRSEFVEMTRTISSHCV